MADTIPVGKYYNFDNKNVDVVYNPATDENKGSSGGGAKVIITMTDDTNGTADKTAAEIKELAQKGLVYAEVQSEYGSVYAVLTILFNFGDNPPSALFTFANGMAGSYSVSSYEIADGNKVKFYSAPISV